VGHLIRKVDIEKDTPDICEQLHEGEEREGGEETASFMLKKVLKMREKSPGKCRAGTWREKKHQTSSGRKGMGGEPDRKKQRLWEGAARKRKRGRRRGEEGGGKAWLES